MRGFVPKRPTTFQQHQKRIEQLLAEGMYGGKAWKDEAFDRYSELEESEIVKLSRGETMNCPECGKPMKNLGNLDGIVMTSNPPSWTDTYVCDDCKVQRNKACSGQTYVKPDLSDYRIAR